MSKRWFFGRIYRSRSRSQVPEVEYSEGPDNGCIASEQGGLTSPPCLVKVDRYGSVSGLVRVRVPLGFIVLEYPTEEDSFGS